MKKRNLLFVVFAIAMFVLCGCSKEPANNQKNESESGDIPTQVALTNVDEVVYLKYTDNTTTVTLENVNSVWYLEGDTETWINQTYVYSIIDAASNLISVAVVEDAGALSEYGLDTPMYTVGLKDAEGNETMIYVGDASSDTNYYATIGDKEEVYIINSKLVGAMVFDTELLKEVVEDELYEEEVYEEEPIDDTEEDYGEETVVDPGEDNYEEDTSSESEE